MNQSKALPFTVYDPDIEDQISLVDRGSHTPNFHAAGSYQSTSGLSFEQHEETPLRDSNAAREVSSETDAAEVPNNTSQPEPEWKPWKLNDPYIMKLPKDEQAMAGWVKVMEESDDRMCKDWKDQIDTLIIFAGVFSATVTAFTIESYKWLDESPADTLARLQLRVLLNATHDPVTMDRLAPATFDVKPSSVLISSLWFSSLTIALVAVIVGMVCKQWLYEYQRYENLTIKEMFLIHGLRYRGLQAWRVPAIISFLPNMLQLASVLFLMGLLMLLGPLQTTVASINTAIVGLLLVFLGSTGILPVIQYVHPMFDTQCPYKSPQSWLFLSIYAFWLFDFRLFTNWVAFDKWEVTRVYEGAGHTLSRVYELLMEGIDTSQIWLSIYSFLADTSLKPIVNGDLAVLSDFVTGLHPSRRDGIVKGVNQTMRAKGTGEEETLNLQRLKQLKNYIKHRDSGRLRPGPARYGPDPHSSFDEAPATTHAYQLRTQVTLSQFLRTDVHISDSTIFNRYIEHWARCINDTSDDLRGGVQWKIGDVNWMKITWPTKIAHNADIQWDPEIGSRIIKFYSYLLRTNQMSLHAFRCLSAMYPSFVESHRQQDITPPPYTLLKDIQEWIDGLAQSNVARGVQNADDVVFCLVTQENILSNLSHASDLEKQTLRSFAQFFVNFYRRRDVSNELNKPWKLQPSHSLALEVLHSYLGQNP